MDLRKLLSVNDILQADGSVITMRLTWFDFRSDSIKEKAYEGRNANLELCSIQYIPI